MRARSFIWLAAVAAVPSADAAAQIAVRVEHRNGRTSGAVVIATPRPGEYRRDRDDGCYEVRGRRDNNYGCHDWYDVGDRRDRDGRYGGRPGPAAVRMGVSIARAHDNLLVGLDREHARWHRSHGWFGRNRGWERSHAALHERLDREHDKWHRSRHVPYTAGLDGFGSHGYAGVGVPGRGRGLVRR